MRKDVTKRNNKGNYGLLREKEAESEPWEKLCIDLIGPYPIPIKGHKKTKDPKPLQLWAVTMIDPATGSNVLEKTCLTRYPDQM